MPGFSAIVYFFYGMERTPEDEKFVKRMVELGSSKELIGIVPTGTTMNLPIPIFTKIEEIESFRKKFS